MALTAIRPPLTIRAPQLTGDRLDAASRAIDGHFLRFGQILGQAVEGLGKLVGSLDQIGITLDPQWVAATTAELRTAAQDLLAFPVRHTERSKTTHRLATAAERLATGIDDMRRTLAYLRVFAINIKITAGGIASAGTEFGDFAQEIGQCIDLGRKRLDVFEADLTALRSAFETALAKELALTEHCAELLPATPNGLIANADAMVAHHQGVGQITHDVRELVRAVQQKTGLALGALQIGDITRQRIEHVSEALDLLHGVEGLSDSQRARMTLFVHNLLTAQLRAAAEDFHRDMGQLREAMSGIAEDGRQILRLRDLALGGASGDDRGLLHQLETHVSQAIELVSDMAQADREALLMGASVSAAAAELSAQIVALRMIKTDVQYMALNTTLKCGRLGDAGKPLAVIAVELRLHAGNMDVSAQAALAALNALTDDANQIALAQDAQTTGFAESIGEALSRVAQRLRAAGDRVEADLAEAAREGEAVVESLDKANTQMNFQQEIGAILDEAAQAVAPDTGAGRASMQEIEAPLRDLLARIAQRYTMVQERTVHQRLTSKLGDSRAIEPMSMSRKPEMEVVLF